LPVSFGEPLPNGSVLHLQIHQLGRRHHVLIQIRHDHQ